jgi:hypothetical protein
MMLNPAWLMIAVLASDATNPSKTSTKPILQAVAGSELAPHGEGNLYAPDVRVENNLFRIWYGGQGRDGHDRIHLAESPDGKAWTRRGVVLDDPTANHVNDPSVVRVGATYHLFSTRAARGIVDEISLATSPDGVRWTKHGVVLGPGAPGSWDSLLVGRPSVLHEGGLFRMWYDGRADLAPGPLAGDAPTSPKSSRHVGYATSPDGLSWTRHPGNPVFDHDAGGVDVKRAANGLHVMVYESHAGTNAATSPDGLAWRDRGLVVPRSGGPYDAHGHVTPMLLIGSEGRPPALYVGAAWAASWDRNAIAAFSLPPALARLLSEPNP